MSGDYRKPVLPAQPRRDPSQGPPRLLLIQVRNAGDPMLAHERACLSARLARLAPALTAHNAVAEPARKEWLDGVDGVVIGGSGNFSVHHPLSQPWVEPLRALLEEILDRSLPGFGICFGHQLLGLHLGTPVATDPHKEELGTHGFQLTEGGLKDPLFSALDLDFEAHTGHSDCVTGVPAGVELLARNERLETQAFKVRDKPFYSVQFHPELLAGEARERYLMSKATTPESLRHAERFRPIDAPPVDLLSRFVAGLPRRDEGP